jgi:hypothetical protein
MLAPITYLTLTQPQQPDINVRARWCPATEMSPRSLCGSAVQINVKNEWIDLAVWMQSRFESAIPTIARYQDVSSASIVCLKY